jgi:hypothetical protein
MTILKIYTEVSLKKRKLFFFTAPKPVEELNATLTGKTVTLEWYIPVNCHFDKFWWKKKEM